MFAQPRHDRRRFFGMAALSLGAAWLGTRDSVMHMITVKPFRLSGASDLASLGGATAWLNSPPLTAADLQGKVVLVDSAVLNAAGGRIAYRFHARDLHLIMGPAPRQGAVPFRVLVDGQPPGANKWRDVRVVEGARLESEARERHQAIPKRLNAHVISRLTL